MHDTDRPYVAVAAIIERDGRHLLVEEWVDDRAVYNQPAGHLELGEDLLAAVRREVLEETAWEFAPEAVVGIYLHPTPRGRTFLRVCFTGRPVAEVPGRALDAEIIRAVWLSEAEIRAEAARLRSPLVLRCIEDWARGRRFPLDVLAHVTA